MVAESHTKGCAVSVANLSKTYGEAVDALCSVNLEIEKGEFVAFIGPSGCGKTTLLRILAGLEKASEGEVSILGKSPMKACKNSDLGVAFQRPALIPSRTARQNVALTLEITRTKPKYSIEDLFKQFGLSEFIDRYPHELSGGMQQRVNIAAALIHDPKILLLDEPFGALDELTRESLGEWLSGILHAGQQTGILVTHSVDEAVMLADRIVILSPRPGKIFKSIEVPFPQPRQRRLRSESVFLKFAATVRKQLYHISEGGIA